MAETDKMPQKNKILTKVDAVDMPEIRENFCCHFERQNRKIRYKPLCLQLTSGNNHNLNVKMQFIFSGYLNLEAMLLLISTL